VFFANDPLTAAPRVPVSQRPSADELAALDRALGRQPRHLAALLVGQWLPNGWAGSGRAAGWQQAVAFVEIAARAVGLQLSRRAIERAPWHPGRCAQLVAPDGTVLGHAGELHPSVCTAFGLPARTAAAEIDLDALIAAAPERADVAAISPFPVAKEDVALIVDADVPAAAVERALRSGAGTLLESVALFDIYTGAQIGGGKKSLAFALRFRASDRTLTDAEAAAARDAAVAAAAEQTGAVQRTL
jgi:phenylalanyl-tRNA synthetase beta chain